MNIRWNGRTVFELIVCIAIPVIVGIIASALTRNSMVTFVRVAKPPLAPPAVLFPIVWLVLYVLMGLASFFIMESGASGRVGAIVLYFIQLVFNFLWSIIFFRSGTYTFAAIWLGVLVLMILCLVITSFRISKVAFFMLLPYLVWCSFALYLNIGIATLNR